MTVSARVAVSRCDDRNMTHWAVNDSAPPMSTPMRGLKALQAGSTRPRWLQIQRRSPLSREDDYYIGVVAFASPMVRIATMVIGNGHSPTADSGVVGLVNRGSLTSKGCRTSMRPLAMGRSPAWQPSPEPRLAKIARTVARRRQKRLTCAVGRLRTANSWCCRRCWLYPWLYGGGLLDRWVMIFVERRFPKRDHREEPLLRSRNDLGRAEAAELTTRCDVTGKRRFGLAQSTGG